MSKGIEQVVATIIIVNFNGKHFLRDCLKSVYASDFPPSKFEIVLVDNNSWDNSLHFVKKNFPKVRIIQNEQNCGFAEGNNIGVKHAKGKYIILLNNDTIVEKNWLSNLINSIEREPESVAAVNGKSLLFHRYIEFVLQSETCPKFEVMTSGESRPFGVYVEKLSLADKQLQHLVDYHRGFYEKEKKDQIGLWTNGNGCIRVPIDPLAQELHCVLMFRTSRMSNTGEKTYACLKLGDKILKEYKLDSQDVVRQEIRLGKQEIDRYSEQLVQNAGNLAFKSGYVRDIGAVTSKNKQSYESDVEYFQQPRELNAFCGVNVLIRKSVFNELGGFDKSFFMYYEDADLSLRMIRAGYKIMYEPNAILHHLHSGSSGNESSTFILYYAERNHVAFVVKHYPVVVAAVEFCKAMLSFIISYLRMVRWAINGSWFNYEFWEDKARYRARGLVWLFLHLPNLCLQRNLNGIKQKVSIQKLFIGLS